MISETNNFKLTWAWIAIFIKNVYITTAYFSICWCWSPSIWTQCNLCHVRLNFNSLSIMRFRAKCNSIYVPGSSEWYSSIIAACELRPRDHKIFICASMNMCKNMMMYCIYTYWSLDLKIFYFQCNILGLQDSSGIHLTSFVHTTSMYYNDDAQHIFWFLNGLLWRFTYFPPLGLILNRPVPRMVNLIWTNVNHFYPKTIFATLVPFGWACFKKMIKMSKSQMTDAKWREQISWPFHYICPRVLKIAYLIKMPMYGSIWLNNVQLVELIWI